MTEKTKPSATHEEILSHLRDSYANVQSVTRFMDTKASATFGASATFLSLIIAYATWLFKTIQNPDFGNIWFTVLLLLAVFSLIVVIFYLIKVSNNAFACINPRDPGGSVSVLFPYIPCDEGELKLSDSDKNLADQSESRIDHFTSGKASQDDLRDDYHRQLSRMGKIVHLKITYSKLAIKALHSQIYWSVGVLATGGIIVLISANS